MDRFEPYHDDEANGVLFEVMVDGRSAQGYISCALLAVFGEAVSQPQDWVAVYRHHQNVIDAAVARRAPAESWDTVMIRRVDLFADR